MIDTETQLGVFSIYLFKVLEEDYGTQIFFLLVDLFESLQPSLSETFDGEIMHLH